MLRLSIITSLVFVVMMSNCSGPQTDSDTANDTNDYYQEEHRPQLHFSPDSMWMNDPNGMVYFDGEYHLFYQYYPDSTVWGPMHWGHAVSTDLLHWEHLPIALYPDEHGLIFSGSAVIDWNNTSGLGKSGQPPMVAIFTYHLMEGEKAGRDDFQTQGMAYSNDKGRSWTKYEGNPVIPNPGIRDFRDPKVIWDGASEQWVMVFAAYDHVKFHGSPNLIKWTHLSDFGKEWGTHGGVWECPDLFPIIEKPSGQSKWVLLSSINPGSPNGGSGTQYFVGQFDGTHFMLDEAFQPSLGTEPAIISDGTLFQGFENGYGEWTSTGTAFGKAPAKGTLQKQNTVSAYLGNHLANSFHGGDATTGTLTSPVFTITAPFINFKTAGGNLSEEVHVDLLVDGKTLRTATGNNSGKLVWTHWDVSELIGQKAQIQLVDQRIGVWGHICADYFMFSEQAVVPAREKAVWLDYGRDNYAGVTWSDLPKEDGRRIFMGWMSNWDYAQVVPTKKWRSAMTLPRILSLQNTEAGPRLLQNFPKEMIALRNKEEQVEIPASAQNFNLASSPQQLEIQLIAKRSANSQGQLGFRLTSSKGDVYTLLYEATSNSFTSDRRQAGNNSFSDRFSKNIHHAPRLSDDEALSMQVIFDRSSVELLADNGQCAITDIFFPSESFDHIEVLWNSESIQLEELKVYTLDGIW